MKKLLTLYCGSFAAIPAGFVLGPVISLLTAGTIYMGYAVYGLTSGVFLAALIQLIALRYRKVAVEEGSISKPLSYMFFILPFLEFQFCVGTVLLTMGII
ncbi:MAG: hypothetical protein IJF56_09290 [Clostridia bacterium]|nr:hypothetical protein [Clostridia bacterium]